MLTHSYIAHWCCSNARVNLNTQCVPSTCFHFYVYREGFTILSLYFLNSASIVQSKKLRSWKTKETLKNFNFQDDFFLSFFIHSFCCFILPHHKKVKNHRKSRVASCVQWKAMKSSQRAQEEFEDYMNRKNIIKRRRRSSELEFLSWFTHSHRSSSHILAALRIIRRKASDEWNRLD